MNLNQFRDQKRSDRTYFQAMAMHAIVSNPVFFGEVELVNLQMSESSVRRNLATTATAIADEMLTNRSAYIKEINKQLKRKFNSQPGHFKMSEIFPDEYWKNAHWCQLAAWVEVCCFSLRCRIPLSEGIKQSGLLNLIKPDYLKSDIEFENLIDQMTTFDDEDFLDLAMSVIHSLIEMKTLISDESAIDEV